MSHYIAYYDDQVGGGRLEHVFAGSPYQRGYGIGSFLAGLLRRALPLIKRGAKALGKEAIRAGAGILDDIGGDNNITFKQAFKNRMYESRDNLKRRAEEKLEKLMNGSGYKKVQRKRRKQSKRNLKRLNTKSRRKNCKRKTVKKRKIVRKRKVVKKKRNIRKKRVNKQRKRSISDIFERV